jgi:hypothetical protein
MALDDETATAGKSGRQFGQITFVDIFRFAAGSANQQMFMSDRGAQE